MNRIICKVEEINIKGRGYACSSLDTTSIAHSYQLARFQLVQNNLARIPHLHSLYCLNVSTTNSSLSHLHPRQSAHDLVEYDREFYSTRRCNGRTVVGRGRALSRLSAGNWRFRGNIARNVTKSRGKENS